MGSHAALFFSILKAPHNEEDNHRLLHANSIVWLWQ